MKAGTVKFHLLLLVFLTLGFGAGASHVMGVDLNYECINNCTIRVHVRAYRDCFGVQFGGTTISFAPQSTGCTPPLALGSSFSTAVITEVTPVCSGWPTRCNGLPNPTINGVQEYYWWRDYDICTAGNCIFTMSWNDCCRNASITSGASNQGIYTGATTLNTTLPICNNSPYFVNKPVPYICAGQPFTFNQGAVDPDGDSISYSLGPCFQSNSGQVTYGVGYSPTSPLGASWGVTIDPQTGDISLSPNPGNIVIGVLCVYVTEWRNGVAINNIVRDMQITVVSCPANSLPTCAGITGLSGGAQNGAYEISVCVNTPISFNMQGTDPNAGQTVTMFWNQNIAAGQFFQTGSPGVQDTVRGANPSATFTWTPTQTGLWTFLLTLQDDACPIIGQNQFTIKINVIAGLQGISASWVPIGCTDVQFSSNPGASGVPPYTYLWNGTGNLGLNPGATSSGLTHTYPGPTAYWYSLTITDSYGCTETIDDSLTVTTGPTADAGPDISMCSGFSTTLGVPSIPGQSYTWSPGGGLSPTNSSNPTLNVTNPGPGLLNLTYQVTAADVFCTAVDFVNITVYPTPVPTITGNLNICNGNSTTLTAAGGSSYLWSTGDTTQSITVNPQAATTYTVSVSNNGCASPPVAATVNVSPGPVAIVTGPTAVCPGSDAALTVVGGTSWLWSTGSGNQTITLSNLQVSTTVSVTASVGPCSGPPTSFTVGILPRPVADFTSTTVCKGDVTQFNDATNDPTGLTTGWIWSFGDATSGPANFSSEQDPQHEYTNSGNFSATLMVTSSNGCRDTVTNSVMVNALPVANFTFSNVCVGLPVTFIDNTPGSVSTWAWEFGEGGLSSQQNPTYSYSFANAYNVGLTVTDNNGCRNKAVRTVFVYPTPQPDFSYRNHCFNRITDFTDLTKLNDPYGTTVTSWTWGFGDPLSSQNSSTLQNPVHNYSPGPYSVTLTSVSSRGCSATVTLPITVDGVEALRPIHDTVCADFPATLRVINPYPGYLIQWFIPNETRPFHYGETFTTGPLLYPVSYQVNVMDHEGCFSPSIAVVAAVSTAIQSGFSANITELEIPYAVVEFSIRDYNIYESWLVSILWDFGDGNTSNLPNPVHQYSKPGVYDVTLTMIDRFGCVKVFKITEYIEVVENVRIWVPNAFSPNRDLHNDEFQVHTQLITDLHINIFDRWGRLVFESNDMNFRWLGKDQTGTELPEGVYMFTIEAHTYDGSLHNKSGSVTLIR